MGVEGLEPPTLSYLVYSLAASQLAITPIVLTVLNSDQKKSPCRLEYDRGILTKTYVSLANIIPRRLPEAESALGLILLAIIHDANMVERV